MRNWWRTGGEVAGNTQRRGVGGSWPAVGGGGTCAVMEMYSLLVTTVWRVILYGIT